MAIVVAGAGQSQGSRRAGAGQVQGPSQMCRGQDQPGESKPPTPKSLFPFPPSLHHQHPPSPSTRGYDNIGLRHGISISNFAAVTPTQRRAHASGDGRRSARRRRGHGRQTKRRADMGRPTEPRSGHRPRLLQAFCAALGGYISSSGGTSWITVDRSAALQSDALYRSLSLFLPRL